jgi:dTDP-4-amino-4,6-dideoxygalactose transaminase
MIRFNDFTADPPALKAAMLQAYTDVTDSGWYVLGPQVAAFESEWAAYCGTPESVGVGNGLDAIEIGLRAAGIGAGDEVITTPMTAVATVLAILRAGATPVLADIEPGTALLSIESVERCRTGRTRAVLLVHLYGHMSRTSEWADYCSRNGLALLEDCAQAHGAAEDGRTAGAVGLWGAFSFYPTKNLGAIGDGGALTTPDADLARAARELRNYGQATRYVHDRLGLNSRLDELQAALLRARLPWLDEFTAARRRTAGRYRDALTNPHVRLLDAPVAPENHVHHLFVLTTDHRDELEHHLTACGVSALSHYPIPVHLQGPYRDLATDPAGLPHAEHHAATCLSLPVAPHLTDTEVDRVVDAVQSFRPSG